MEIPDDGNWLCVSWVDASAPVKSSITEVHVRYALDHADPSQLEIRLTKVGSNINQVLWNRGAPAQGTRLRQALGLESFKGVPAQGEWQVWVRDLVPGQKGRLMAATVRALYAPVGSLPRVITGTPGRPTTLRIPIGTVKSKTPDADKKKPTPSNQSVAPRQPSSWQEIKSETFEGVFPNAGWEVLDGNGGDEYWWDDDDFRPHSGGWAAWPANGGANGLDPATYNYPPNMNSQMKYGPFDLRNTTGADISFWLWRQIEPYYDWVFFGISTDNDTYNGWYWDGSADWQRQQFDLSDYKGNATVWVAWVFSSDDWEETNWLYEGPWVDDIVIRKYVPGLAMVRGSLWYNNRAGAAEHARFMKAYLYDDDGPPGPDASDDLLATTTTDINGFFQFQPITNWDADDTDPDPNNRRLDLYVRWETDYNDSGLARRRVTNLGDATYWIPSDTRNNVADGITEFNNYLVTPNSNEEWATRIFQDLRRAWAYVSPTSDPGSTTVRWQIDQNCFTLAPLITVCNSFFWPDTPLRGIFIRDDQKFSPDILIHELGHQYMYNTHGSFWYSLDTWHDFSLCVIVGHGINVSRTELCAWTEGWGNFLPLAVNGDPCFDFDIRNGSCGGVPDHDHFNLETHSRNDNPQDFHWGDTVEGRVAGALYDLFDNANEPPWFDNAAFGFAPIWSIVRTAPHENSFREFWESWRTSGNNKHRAVQAIYQNTIDYDTAPVIADLPDRTVLQSHTWNRAIDLWPYSYDTESTWAELGWQIINVTDWRCGVTLESNRYVNLAPQQGWLGFCDVTISVSDGIKIGTDIFRVNVEPVRGRIYLPIILK